MDPGLSKLAAALDVADRQTPKKKKRSEPEVFVPVPPPFCKCGDGRAFFFTDPDPQMEARCILCGKGRPHAGKKSKTTKKKIGAQC